MENEYAESDAAYKKTWLCPDCGKHLIRNERDGGIIWKCSNRKCDYQKGGTAPT